MKGCLILNGASPRTSPRPPARKCVSFCGSGSNSSASSDDEQELVEVHVADDWDRSPCEITPKLTYQDLVELHELRNSVANPQNRSNLPRPPQLLNRVPVGLLPLLSETSASPSKPPSKVGSKSTSSVHDACPPKQSPFLRKPCSNVPPNSALTAKFSFLPLLPMEDQSTAGQTTQSSINPQSPATVPNRFEKKFQFVPLFTDESTSSSEPPSDDDHPSPISTPSLTASSSLPSPPGSPSATSSPSLVPHLPTSDYFNLSRPPAGANQNSNRMHSTGVDSSFSKLTLKAPPSASSIPPSSFNIRGGNSQSKEKLDNSGSLGRKGGKRCVVEYININGVDEPFYSYVDDDEPPSPVSKSELARGILPPPNGFLPLYE
ncbi:hypothetical protein BJ322DRAFT_1108293 [Thelephora terrestris]|uniref:Uncharacterized protein n=1 Tax=Thelephora terrestris TaxID=56493 RepID=A0A9P6L7W6_9AGAM|nr:hypothetical protein BJ322DRAFT_1108293 [Thelephora terrestris]